MIDVMKKLFAFVSGATLSLAVAAPAYAQQVLDLCPLEKPGQAHRQFNPLCALTGDKAGNVFGVAITILFIAAIVIAIFFLVLGGIKWILSGGDKGKVEEARNHIVAAVVGLVIALASYFILTFVIKLFLPDFDISRITLPTLR